MTGSVTFSTGIGGDGSTVTDDNNATTGLRDGGWRTRFVPCFTNQVSIANYVVTQANAASASATAAGSSATSAAAAYDSFDDRYLGSKTSDPTLDNDGNALLTGALYWNSTSSVMKVYSGSAWVSAYVPSSSYLALTGGTMTGAITFASAQFGTNVNTFLTTPSSANLAVALTDKTGTGVNVFNNTPTLITPILGTPQSGTLTNCTGLPLSAGITGTLPVANGGTGTTTPALVAGTNVTISGTWPNQTINASGGTSLTGITGATNTALGVSALTSITTGFNNSAVGTSALTGTTTGASNTSIGNSALYSNTAGGTHTAVGAQALYSCVATDSNTAVGYQALYAGTTVDSNVAVGFTALKNSTTNNQVAVGYQALAANTTGSQNTAVGHNVLRLNTTGSSNIAIGNSALYSNTTGSSNSADGTSALYSNTTGTYNSAMGASALTSNTTGGSNSAMGHNALQSNTTGGQNSAMGQAALAFNTTGEFNSAMGQGALAFNTTGEFNSAMGQGALLFNTTGFSNSAMGQGALVLNTTGVQNVATGYNALYSNTTGSYNVGIGASVASSTTTVSNEVNIYNNAVTARFQGSASSWSFVSDVRDKTNIVDLELGLNFINKLQPRKFEWDLRHTDVDKGKAASGFIAQEVLSVLEQEDALFTGLVDTNDSEKYMLAQTGLIPMLVNAIKELTTRLEILEGKLK